MAIIETNHPFLDVIVPTVGFIISTFYLPYVKEWWIQARHYYRHGESQRTTSQRRLAEAAQALTMSRRPPPEEESSDVEQGGRTQLQTHRKPIRSNNN